MMSAAADAAAVRAAEQKLRRLFQTRRGFCVFLRRVDGTPGAAWRRDLAKSAALPPGSALKPFLLEAFLRRGLHREVVCTGRLSLGGHRLDCVHPVIAQPIDAELALAYSCNQWFAKCALLLGPDACTQALRATGAAVERVSSAEMLQLQALGMDGVRITAWHLAQSWLRFSQDTMRKDPVLTALWRGLAAGKEFGTTQRAGANVIGKTGTTQRGAWFGGFTPELAGALFVEGGTGGGDAAPMAAEVFDAWARAR